MRNFIFSFLALILLPAYMSGQVIKGKVLDENGVSMPGVNITVVSSNAGTISDFDGNFSINVSEGEPLQFSFIGYQTATVNASQSMSVQLQPSSTDLSEVVVIGYGTQKKADVTGSISVVNAKDLENKPNGNALSSVQGKVAGVVITNSGKPGASPGIAIRGIGTIAGNDPTYVVDGVITNDISYLNPNDIENMSILKDASSSAIYGIRAANGVIVITTKMGRKAGAENIKLSFDSSIGFQKTTNIPEYANAADYVSMYNDKLAYEGLDTPENLLNLSDFNGVDTDWMDEILRETAVTTTQNLSLTGASEKTRYSLGLGYFKQEGLLDAGKGVSSGEDYKRVTARFNGVYDVTDKFTLGANVAYYKFDSNDAAQPFQIARITPSVIPVYNADGSYGTVPEGIDLGTAGYNNPRMTLDNFRGKSKGTRTLISGFAEYEFLKGLKYKLNYSRDFSTIFDYQYTPEFNSIGTGALNQSKLTNSYNSFENVLIENTLTWEKTIDKHRFVVLAGASREQRTNRLLRGAAIDVPFEGDDSTLYLNLGTQANVDIADGDEGNKIRFQSYFGRIQYAFDDKYLLNATLRRDGASVYNFDGNQKAATFPAVGIGWVMSNESFMKNSGLDFLKLKASWGELGNANVTRQYDETATTLPGAFFGSPSQVYQATSVTQLVDTSINWEVVEEYDLGFELKALSNKLSIEGGYYNRETSDAIFNITSSPLSGLSGSLLTNAGSFVNKGFEFTASWNSKIGDDFTYSLYGNLTTIDNEITEVLGGSFFNTGPGLFGNPIKRYEVGQEIGAYYGFQTDGVVQNETESAATGLPIGSLKFKDLDGNGTIDDEDKTFLGSPIPNVTYGFGFSVGYKDFDFAAEFQGVAGNEIYNFNRNSRFGNENWDQDFVDNHWTPENPTNAYPAANSNQTSSRPSSFYVEKGDYFRVRNLQLGYSLPRMLLDKIKIDRIRVYVSAQNPFTSFKYNGFSPELGKQNVENLGIDNNAYPLSATYSFGINFNF